MIIEVILYIIFLITSLPIGLFLAWLCEDELIKDRKYFILLSYALLIAAIFIFIFYFKLTLILSLIYMVFVLWVLIRRGRKIELKRKK